ncbi:MAG: hydroxymethylglutaryl-CoA synthase family protein [Deltaproteobacteria bacterium]|nr:hydroxymethylglutaryl-CoA synthase family protein [Deltaproteobacteria bacterium]
MVGIVSYGGHIPVLRMERKVIASAWGRGSIVGERSIANNDEDCITMAVEAATNCLYGRDRECIDGLFFSSTTSPYLEKMNSALVAGAADLRRDIITTDFSNSLRSGTAALKAALDSVKSGSTRNLIITAADSRLAYPRSDQEQIFGDGAAALWIGNENLVATYEGGYAITNDMMDVWRNPDDRFVKQWEGRFILGEGYAAHIKEVVKGIMKKYDLRPDELSKVIFTAPDGRSHNNLVKALGFDGDTQVQDPLLANVGNCGAAHPLMMLAAALEDANPGDLLLLATYADGADAMLFKATGAIFEKVNKHSMKSLLESKLMFSSYARFLSYKNVFDAQPGEPFRLIPSATASWREANSSIRLHASKCNACGVTTFPVQRICYNCHSKDEFEEIRISDRTGTVFTFTRDNLAGRSDDPVLIQTVAEIQGNIRFYGLMTDFEPSEVTIGMPVEMTFRRLYDGAGFHNYFWKLRPIRKEGE